MSITIELPDEIAQQLERAWGAVSRRALEAVALEGYRSGDLSTGQVAELLGLSAISYDRHWRSVRERIRLVVAT